MTNCSGYEDLNTNCGYCGCSADEHTNGQCVATDMYIKKSQSVVYDHIYISGISLNWHNGFLFMIQNKDSICVHRKDIMELSIFLNNLLTHPSYTKYFKE